jgi:GNAT superfamily N-acetyltransferase
MTTDLIKRVDRVEDASFRSLYTAGEPWGTGWHEQDGVTAVWAGQDDDPSFSCVLNLAASPDPERTLLSMEQVVRAHGGLVLGVDTHPDLENWATEKRLKRLGFERDCQECIWARELAGAIEQRTLSPGLTVERAQASQREVFARVLNAGWNLPLEAARGYVFAATIGMGNWFHYLAYVDESPAGVSVMFVHDCVADCFLSATLPEYRGRGIQTALIERRLVDGLVVRCDLATSQTVVTNASPRNMARQGFTPLYRRWIYGKRLRV